MINIYKFHHRPADTNPPYALQIDENRSVTLGYKCYPSFYRKSHSENTYRQCPQRWCVMVGTCDEYELYENIGMIPANFKRIEVGDTTRSMCRQLCSGTYDLSCSGFLYNRRLQKCELSAYTGEWVTTAGLTFNSSSGLEFYRRKRCLGQISLFVHSFIS